MSAMTDIWTQGDYAEYERQRKMIYDAYPWMEQARIDRWAANIVNQQKGL